MKSASLVLIAATMPCAADVTVTIEEVGGDVYVSGSGTFDVSLWEFGGRGEIFGWIVSWQLVVIGPSKADAIPGDAYVAPVNLQGPDAIGEVGPGFFADSGNGDPFGLIWDEGGLLVVPLDYESGAELEGDATFLEHSFDSLGLEEGSYTWTWDTADGAGDSFTVIVGPAGCDADVNGDGELDVLDFVAFQQLWQDGDPGADCDANGAFNVLDFVCFQQLFQAGCG
jgi:hypothetical protein